MSTEKIYNLETEETLETSLTEERLKKFAEINARFEAELQKEEQKRLARNAVLEKLGLTADEAAALLA
jgi:Pyruvate/2-oxoacid:ferredoxin oxidoreductase gamma subunit